MTNVVVLVTPGLEHESTRLQTATGMNSRATVAGPVPLVALGADDAAAVREARSAAGGAGTVVALTVGDDRAVAALRGALAQGADRAVLVRTSDASVLSTHEVATHAAAALGQLEPADLVVLGQRGGAYATGLLPGYLAAVTGRDTIAHVVEGAAHGHDDLGDNALLAVARDRSNVRPVTTMNSILDAFAVDIRVIESAEPGQPVAHLYPRVSPVAPGPRAGTIHEHTDERVLAAKCAHLILSSQSDA